MYQVIVINKDQLAVPSAVVTPLDIAQQEIRDNGGMAAVQLCTNGGVCDVDDTVDGYTVAFLSVSAPGYVSQMIAPSSTQPNLVTLVASSSAPIPLPHDSARPLPAVKTDLTSGDPQPAPAAPTAGAPKDGDMDDRFALGKKFMTYHLSMRMAFGIVVIAVVAFGVYMTSKSEG